MSNRNKVFISYSHEDASWLLRLRVHLRPLEREHSIEFWDDTRIKPGSRWRQEIEAALARARVAVLLISADFLASDFIVNNELPPLLEAAENEGAVILPVIISPSRFLKTRLAQFQAINNPSLPLIKLTKGEQEDVFVNISERIEVPFETIVIPQIRISAQGQNLIRSEAPDSEDAIWNLLEDIPLIIYYESARDEAKQLRAILSGQGMLLDKMESGLGYTGAKTIMCRSNQRKIAQWMKRNIDLLGDFQLVALGEEDGFTGIIINLW